MMSEPSALDAQRMMKAALAYLAPPFAYAVFPCFEWNAATQDCACGASSKTRNEDRQCTNPGKHPRTGAGFKNATRSDPEQVRRWWRQAPMANIGIACGASQLVVIDVDPRNGGDETLRALLAQHGPFPDTPQQLTGGGGVHYFFRRPDWPVVAAPAGGLGLGVDVQADGKYIIAAPSTHYLGKPYAWDLSYHPRDLAPAPLPDWILERLSQRERVQQPAGGAVIDGFLGRAFQLAGWLGRPLGPDKAAVQCPWHAEHSSGTHYDGSTIVFAPTTGHRFGWFHCSHAHCAGLRSAEAVLAALPEAVRVQAKQQLGLSPTYDGSRERARLRLIATEEPAARPGRVELTDPDDWSAALRRAERKDGSTYITRDVGNVALLLANDPEWAGVLQYDAFADEVRFVRPVPAIPGLVSPQPDEALRDHHWPYVQHWLALRHDLSIGQATVAAALVAAAHRNVVHPLRTYLEGLGWDQRPRLDGWMSTYLAVEDTPYTRAVGNWWMVSAIARALRPGCQADHLLIFEGGQGAGKSTTVRILAGGWCLEHLPDVRSKDAQIDLQGVWLVEIDELDAFKGAGGTRVKSFVTRTGDTYRPPYGRTSVTRGRGCVFVGTTNERTYLHDASGARRFWPVRFGRLDRDALVRDRDQLWAEARTLFEEGAPWWPTDAMRDDIEAEQEERFETDEWESRLAVFVADRSADLGVTTAEALDHLGLKPHEWGKAEQMRVASALRRLGWDRPRDGRRRDGSRVWLRHYPKGGSGVSPRNST
jgi:hypothetical protein